MSLFIERHLSTFYQQNGKQMFEKIIEIYILVKYYLVKEFRTNVFAIFTGGAFMDYKNEIIKMLERVNDVKVLKLIYEILKRIG